MLKHLSAAFAAIALSTAPGHAALIDFAAEADNNGERGLALGGENIVIGGVALFLSSTNNDNTQAHAYLDETSNNLPAGLGACQMLIGADQCDPASDDNVTAGEGVSIAFLAPVTITDIVFRAADHTLITVGSVAINSVTDTFSSWIAQINSVGLPGQEFTFDYVDTQFYVSSLTIADDNTPAVPIPAALPLLISGLAGLGFASRNKKAA